MAKLALVSLAGVVFTAASSAAPSPPPKPVSWNCTEQPVGAFNAVPLKNEKSGISAYFIPYGATITSLLVPDSSKYGALDVLLGFDDTLQYCANAQHPYFGATIGRIANRIANASFTLDGAEYLTAINEPSAFGGNTLHGGWVGWDRRVWQITHQSGSSVGFHLDAEDGEQGFPGAVSVQVNHTLTDDGAWLLEYAAMTSSPVAVVSATNHAYFNLNANVGGEGTVKEHVLSLPAGRRFLQTDSTLIPTGVEEPVAAFPAMDFLTPKPVGRDLNRTVLPNGGYDNAYVLVAAGAAASAADSGLPPGLTLAASVSSPLSGIGMEVWTDQPSLQVYSGNGLDGTLPRKASQGGPDLKYEQYGALALETQAFVDALHHPEWPSVVLRPGQVYRQTTAYRFLST